jgi:hypothetical protein
VAGLRLRLQVEPVQVGEQVGEDDRHFRPLAAFGM